MTVSKIAPFHVECLHTQACDTCVREANRCRLDSETVAGYLAMVARTVQLQGR